MTKFCFNVHRAIVHFLMSNTFTLQAVHFMCAILYGWVTLCLL